jgi:hypothetical protein
MKAVAKRLAVSVVLCAGLALATSSAFAQKTANPNPYDPLVHQLNQAQTKLGPQMKYLSGGLINAFGIAKHWESLKAGLGQAANAAGPQAGVKAAAGTPVTTTSLASRVLGFTQGETSTAWCGTNAVVGFNDSGSVIETIGGTLAGNGLSTVGYGQSTNANAGSPVFADKGAVPAPTGVVGSGSTTGGWLIGDPVVACSSASKFYMSNVGFSCQFSAAGGGVACGITDSTVNVSISSDGGATFAPAVVAVDKSFAPNILGLTAHMLDKDWMAIDPVSNEIYLTYTDIDNSTDIGNVCGLAFGVIPIQRVAIELVSSTNGGATWSSPHEIIHVCDDPLSPTPNLFVQGSQIAIGTDESVYVAWETTGTSAIDPNGREIDIAKSPSGGVAFGAPTKVTYVKCAGDCIDGILQGSIRINEFPSLTAGKGSQSGKFFVAWNDGDNPQTDLGVGTYDLTDIKLTPAYPVVSANH